MVERSGGQVRLKEPASPAPRNVGLAELAIILNVRLAVMDGVEYSRNMRTTTAAVRRTIPASEIRRRGMSAVDKALKRGPVHVLRDNEPAYVIMAEDQFRELSDRYRKSYISRIRRSLKDVKTGRVRRVTAQRLIGELGLDV